MFWKRVEYIFEWTVQTPWTLQLAHTMRELGWRSRRAVLIGVVIGWCTYGVCGLILPSLELPWWRGLLFVLGVSVATGLLFTAISKVAQKGSNKNYRLAETFVRLPDGKQARLKGCIACFVHPTEARLELVRKHDSFTIIDLPEDTTLREAIIAFIMARVPHWTHSEAPQELYARSGQLQGFPLFAYWVSTLGGSVAVAASLALPSSLLADNIMSILLLAYVVGPGAVWGWTAWRKLAAFPWYWRLRMALIWSLIGNMVWAGLFQQFLIAFAIARIVP
jgi:hypothetical protein